MITLRFFLNVDKNGIKLQSSGEPHKLNQLEQYLSVEIVKLVKSYLEHVSKQLEADLKAKQTTSQIVGAHGERIKSAIEPESAIFGLEPAELSAGTNGTSK